MHISYLVVALVATASNIYAAAVDFVPAGFVIDNMRRYGVPLSWVSRLGAIKAAGAAGLLVGLAVPAIGIAAAIGLVLYYLGAVTTVIRARCYGDIGYPVPFLALAAATLAFHLV
jgi:hypothetical protein